MRRFNSFIGAVVAGSVTIVLVAGVMQHRTEAQAIRPVPMADDIGVSVGRAIASRIVTLKFPASRGEPKEVAATIDFGRRVENYWISVIGVDVQFTRSTEKQINRQLWSVKPSASAGGHEVELRGRLGLRDGSGEFDDSYEGSIDVQVTAVLSD